MIGPRLPPAVIWLRAFPKHIKLMLLPDAYHDFDAPDRPVVVRQGLAYTAHGNGLAHVGTNEPGRELALR